MNLERRNSRRLPPAHDRDEAQITCRRQTEPALILNVSAGGFRVCVRSGFVVKVGDEARLETIDGRHLVRIANVEQDADRLNLGLERIQDLVGGTAAKTEQHAGRKGNRVGSGGLWVRNFSVFVNVGLPIVIILAIMTAAIGFGGVRSVFRWMLHLFRM